MSNLYSLHIQHLEDKGNEDSEREGELFKDKEELLYKFERLEDLLDLVNRGELELPVVVDETGTFYEVKKTQQ